MELKDFIRESLVQVATGIEEANEQLIDSNACVNPREVEVYSSNAKAYGRVSENQKAKDVLPLVEIIDFDVAVQVESGSEAGGELKYQLLIWVSILKVQLQTRKVVNLELSFEYLWCIQMEKCLKDKVL